MPGTEPMPSPSPDPRKRSSLLGPRKSAAPPDKPSLLGRRPSSKATPADLAPAATPPEPVVTPLAKAPKKAKAKAKAPAPPRLTLASLQAQIELLQAALQRCPSWTDLELLEARLIAPPPSDDSSAEAEKLHETLQNRTEELDELAQINAELQEENEELRERLTQLEHKLDRQREVSKQTETRLAAAEGLLRESLLSLISPGDEFYEELVEQIQRFLGP